jgi:hypothetical protein
MKNQYSLSVLLAATLAFSASASVMARDIVCSIPAGSPTVNGIRHLEVHKNDWEGFGRVDIIRDGAAAPEARAVSFNMSDISWGESSTLEIEGMYAAADVVELKKSGSGENSTFKLVKTRWTLSGPHCDGYHSCHETSDVIESVSVACTDTHDLIKPSTGSSCDPSDPDRSCHE